MHDLQTIVKQNKTHVFSLFIGRNIGNRSMGSDQWVNFRAETVQLVNAHKVGGRSLVISDGVKGLGEWEDDKHGWIEEENFKLTFSMIGGTLLSFGRDVKPLCIKFNQDAVALINETEGKSNLIWGLK
jgi:hypothetical protein